MTTLIVCFDWPRPGDQVRLRHSFPDIGLPAGSVGLVCDRWAYPTSAYEIEFNSPDAQPAVRALILGRHVERC